MEFWSLLLGSCKGEGTELMGMAHGHGCVGAAHLSVVEDHLVKFRGENHALVLADLQQLQCLPPAAACVPNNTQLVSQ